MHRDLKHLNILVSGVGEDGSPKVLITDFGMSIKLEQGEYFTPVKKGTPGYQAPEVIKKQPCDFKVDVWALGVILYSLLCANVPFKGQSDSDINQATLYDELVFTSVAA